MLSSRLTALFNQPKPMMYAAQRYGAGNSPLGGTPPNDMSQAPATPQAPPVASRTKPGVVPMKVKGR